jgi:hypothetical protein
MKSDDAKTETLQFKVTEQERKLIERCATEEGTTVSKYVSGAVLMSMVMDGKSRSHQDRGARGRRGGKAGPRRMPAGCGAERNGPRLGNTGALPTALRTGVR